MNSYLICQVKNDDQAGLRSRQLPQGGKFSLVGLPLEPKGASPYSPACSGDGAGATHALRTVLWKTGSGRCLRRTMGVYGLPRQWKDADIRGADEGWQL